jgi:hypothetical protein
MILYHCTTNKKIERYTASGRIMAPVRGFNTLKAANEWCRHTGRNVILWFEINADSIVKTNKE